MRGHYEAVSKRNFMVLVLDAGCVCESGRGPLGFQVYDCPQKDSNSNMNWFILCICACVLFVRMYDSCVSPAGIPA